MAKIKSPTMTTNPPIKATETSTQSSTSSASTLPQCPNCRSTFSNMSSREFNDHVAMCTRPSTANFDDDSDSSLSSPPVSPLVSPQRSAEDLIIVDSQGNDEDEEGVFTYDTKAELELQHGNKVDFPLTTEETGLASARPSPGSSAIPTFSRSFANPVIDSDIRPYLNPDLIFDYYDAINGNELVDDKKSVNGEEVAADSILPPPLAIEKSVNGKGKEIASEIVSEVDERAFKSKDEPFKYPKLTPIETFVEYLKNADDLSYEDLYHRTDLVSGVLYIVQDEFDKVNRQIAAHESTKKGEIERAEQDAQDRADQEQAAKNRSLFEFQEKYAEELALEGEQFEAMLENLRQRKKPKVADVVFEQFANLKDPQFMATWQKELDRDDPRKHLINVPIKEPKPTKEEIETEKRQRGKLLDPVKFNDIKMADVYSFEHSTHPKHVGQQPLPELEVAPVRPVDTGRTTGPATQGTRRRVARKQTRKVYEASHTPEAEPERLPTKRVRKQPTLTSTIQSRSQSRAGPSRAVTPPPVRVFASGKRVGRPPTKSKLNAVHRAPSLEAELQTAAESLVNKTKADKAVANPGLTSVATDPNDVLPSTEQDDASRVTSANTSRPTTSSSNATTSTTSTRRSNRAATREKTQARELKAQELLKTTGKRKRGTTQVEESVSQPAPIKTDDIVNPPKRQKAIGVDPAASQTPVPAKKRKTRAVSEVAPLPDVQEDSDADVLKPSRKRKGSVVDSSAAQTSVSAKKHKANGDSQFVSIPDVEETDGEAPKASRKRKGSAIDSSATKPSVPAKKRKINRVSQPAQGTDEEFKEDEEDLTPAEKEEKRLAEVKAKKSRLLSQSMKNRWASGGMAVAQATRRANAAAKKASKLQAVADSDAGADDTSDALAGPSQPVSAHPPQLPSRAPSVAPTTSTKSAGSKTVAIPKATNAKAAAPKTAPKVKKAKTTSTPTLSVPVPASPPSAPAATNGERRSGRVRKPTRAGLGLDGADDYEEEEPRSQLLNEYEHYQQISDPNSPMLGKRARRPLKFSFADDYASEDEEYL